MPNKVSSKETVNVSKPSKSHLSDLLTCPLTSTSSAPKRPSTRARLLTSDECLRMLEEKEKKKEMETQEKEKRRNERAAKKKEREELLQKKKEEKAKKAEERAKKAEEKARKTSTSRKQKKSTTSEPSPSAFASICDETTAARSAGNSNLDRSGDESIDVNVCCMCFVHYDDDVREGSGADWIFCKCGRWLHEDCIEDVVKDNEGTERFCSFCVDKFTI